MEICAIINMEMIFMNRKEREITDWNEILDVLNRCEVLRVAMTDGETPYVVPVSFGPDTDGEMPVLYFHGAKRGMKLDFLRKNPKVCVEGDVHYGVAPTAHGITAHYESVIGFGTAEVVSGEEKILGLKRILAHYGHPEHPVEQCRGLEQTEVVRITLNELTGKRNLPE